MPKKIWILCSLVLFIILAGCSVNDTPSQENWEPINLQDVIEDQQGDGWYWNAEEKNLILDGLDLVWDARKVEGGTAFQLPNLAQIVLAEGSKNRIHIRAKEDTIITAFSGMGTTYIDGTGRLDITGENLRVGLVSTSDIEMHGGTISMQNETERISSLFETKEQYIQYGGDITAKNTMIRAENGIVVHDGSVEVENFIEPFQVMDGDIEINSGKVNIRQAGKPETSADLGIASDMISIYDDWIINGGEVYATGIRANGGFIVNDGVVKVDGVGINLQTDGHYEQYGGNVTIYSDRAGLFNTISQEDRSETDKRIIIECGILEIVSRNLEYSIIEVFFEKEQNQNIYDSGIVIGDKMKINAGEWITENITENSEIRQRDELQGYKEGQEYMMTALQGSHVKITDSN